jgi:hypothetical protein
MTALEGLFAEDVVSYSDGGRLVRAAGAHPQTPLSWPPDVPRVAQRKFGGFQTVVSAPPKLASGNGQVGPHLVFFEVSQCRLCLVLLSQRSRALRVRAISESAPVHPSTAFMLRFASLGRMGQLAQVGPSVIRFRTGRACIPNWTTILDLSRYWCRQVMHKNTRKWCIIIP